MAEQIIDYLENARQVALSRIQSATQNRDSELDLSMLPLENLPKEITYLKDSLQTLQVYGCELKSFPLEICELVKLERLNIGFNNITYIPPELSG